MYIFDTWVPSNPLKQGNNDIDRLPVVKILQYEYEHLKRRSKRLEILERAFLECQKSEFEEFNKHPNCSFASDKKQKEVKEDK